jgi:sarcosine oxidase subunit gamma
VSDLVIAEHANLSLAMVIVRRVARAAAEHAMRDRIGLELPPPGRLTGSGATMLLWHGPDRILAVRNGTEPKIAPELDVALAGTAHVVEASASRLVMTVSGADAAEALSRHLPIDLHPRLFTPGSVALTRVAHIDVLVWRTADAASFGLACASSYGESFRRVLASG